MGATNCPETPRQRMISMMYLVLTALLALNVSKEILDSFLIVNESLITTNENFTKKIELTYSQFDKQLQINKVKVQSYWDRAQQARKLSKEMVAFIEKTKVEVIAAESKKTVEECKDIDLRSVGQRDRYVEGTRYFIGNSETGANGKAAELRKRIEDYKTAMLNLIDPKNRTSMNLGLDTKGPYKNASGRTQNWEMHNFYYTILVANVVILNKLIAEVKNAEFDVVNRLLVDISGLDFKFDQVGAKVVARSNYVLTGETFEADIFVAAYDTKQTPEIIVGSAVDSITHVISGEQMKVEGLNGVGKLKMSAGAPGVRQFGGLIKIKGADGTLKEYPFNSEYVVGTPSATISPTKMNVFYIGVDNPVSISVPGASNEQVTATITGGGGTISKVPGNGLYVVKVSTQGECTVNVSAKMGATSRSMGSMKFRVKRIPDPVAYVGGSRGGPIPKSSLLAAGGVIPKMDGFDFDVYPTITSFTLAIVKGGDYFPASTNGAKFSSQMIQMLNSVTKGQKVFIEDIKARLPDGTTRNLGAITLKVN
ncbi:MAG: gliding motility protein GldM [Bacteroidota bacterium]